MIKLFKKNSYRWSVLGLAVLIGLGCLFLTNGKTTAETAAPQRVLENYLNIAKAGDIDKAFTYITATGITDSELKKTYKDSFTDEKLLYYKINKVFNDDPAHVSVILTVKTTKQVEMKTTMALVKKDGEWKISWGAFTSAADVGKPLNEIDNRPSMAEVELRKEAPGKDLGYAQPSAQPSAQPDLIRAKDF